jgi:membrane protein YqaA with SNARE-associated domain
MAETKLLPSSLPFYEKPLTGFSGHLQLHVRDATLKAALGRAGEAVLP